MVNDGLYDKVPKPDILIGGHVFPVKTGVIGTRRGVVMSAADSFQFESTSLSTARTSDMLTAM